MLPEGDRAFNVNRAGPADGPYCQNDLVLRAVNRGPEPEDRGDPAQGRADGWTWTGRGLFGPDVFLACVYAVYMYTVFRVRLSQEFNRILPELPELVQRVLGVRHLGGEYG